MSRMKLSIALCLLLLFCSNCAFAITSSSNEEPSEFWRGKLEELERAKRQKEDIQRDLENQKEKLEERLDYQAVLDAQKKDAKDTIKNAAKAIKSYPSKSRTPSLKSLKKAGQAAKSAKSAIDKYFQLIDMVNEEEATNKQLSKIQSKLAAIKVDIENLDSVINGIESVLQEMALADSFSNQLSEVIRNFALSVAKEASRRQSERDNKKSAPERGDRPDPDRPTRENNDKPNSTTRDKPDRPEKSDRPDTVSYTHLTLPTNREV